MTSSSNTPKDFLPTSLATALERMTTDGQLVTTMFTNIIAAQTDFNQYFSYINKYDWSTVGYMAYVKYDIDQWLDAGEAAIPGRAVKEYVMLFQQYRKAFDNAKLAGEAKNHLAKAMKYLYYALNIVYIER